MKTDLIEMLNQFAKDKENEYVTKQKPVYEVKECLNLASKTRIEKIYNFYTMLTVQEKEYKTKAEKINFIIENLTPACVLQIIYIMPKEKIDEIITTGKTEFNMALCMAGCQFGFIENGKEVFIIPQEIREIIRKEFASDDEEIISEMNNILAAYFMINGILSTDTIDNIIKYLIPNISREKITDIKTKLSYQTYKGHYCLIDPSTKEAQELIDTLIEIKQKNPILLLSYRDIKDYLNIVQNISKDISELTKSEETQILFKLSAGLEIYETNEELVDDLLKYLKIDKKYKENILTILEHNYFEKRFWSLNGYTYDEFNTEKEAQKLLLKNVPKNNQLKTAIECLDNEGKNQLKKKYKAKNIENLKNKIISSISELEPLNEKTLKTCLEEQEIKYSQNVATLITEGLVFHYINKNNKEVLYIPDEIREFIEEKRQSFKDILNNLAFKTTEQKLSDLYIDLNGIIEKKELQRILKEHHSIDLTIKKLDQIVDESYKLDDVYYIWDKNLLTNSEYISLLKELKKENSPEICTPEVIKREERFHRELDNLIHQFYLSFEKMATLSIMLEIQFRTGFFLKEDSLEYTAKEIKLEAKEINQLKSFIERYKNSIGLWMFRGKTVNDFANIPVKKVKIGRNELCPCGSGKKYKKCCGKNA